MRQLLTDVWYETCHDELGQMDRLQAVEQCRSDDSGRILLEEVHHISKQMFFFCTVGNRMSPLVM